MKKNMIILLLTLNLALVFTATRLFKIVWLPIRMQMPVFLYQSYVGALSYGFFAIEITTQPIAKCYVLDHDDTMKEEVFGVESDSYAFKSGIIFQILGSMKDPETVARLTASYCYRIHPHARVVRVSLGQYVPPSIQGYKAHKRPTYFEQYTATYLHE